MLDIPIVEGRNFTPEEARAHEPVVIISDATARRLLPDRDVVGQEIRIYGDARSNWGEQMPSVLTVRVIGVARDIVSCCLLYGKDAALIYFPVTAVEAKGSLLLRVRGDAAAASHSLDRKLAKLVPGGVEELHPLSDGLALSTYPFRAASWISASLGALALLLAVSGIHGVLSYLITQRSKELAIRVALGGTTRAVAGLVLKQSMRLVAIGIGVGAVLALGLSGFLAAHLVHLNAFDVFAYGGGMTLVSVAALAATYFPARRAARIDPMAGTPSRLSLTRGGGMAPRYTFLAAKIQFTDAARSSATNRHSRLLSASGIGARCSVTPTGDGGLGSSNRRRGLARARCARASGRSDVPPTLVSPGSDGSASAIPSDQLRA